LPRVFYAAVRGRDSNPRPLDRESDAPPQHHDATIQVIATLLNDSSAFDKKDREWYNKFVVAVPAVHSDYQKISLTFSISLTLQKMNLSNWSSIN